MLTQAERPTKAKTLENRRSNASGTAPEPSIRGEIRRSAAAPDFYHAATLRNLGLLSEEEQETLRHATVAIAGVGAVGGHYLLALVRLGVENFVIADPDRFEAVNMHRQAGAFLNTLGCGKVAAMAEMARNINPNARIRAFHEPLTQENAAMFLAGADIALDGIDFFQIDARRALHREARRQGIHSITSGPIGHGSSLHVFDPAGMSFDDYFDIRPHMTRAQRIAAFAAGLLPSLRAAGAVDADRVDFESEKAPALISSVLLCAGIVTSEVLRVLLKRGKPLCAPHAFYFDPYTRRFIHRKRVRARWLDRIIRGFALRRYPSLVRLHQAELQARTAAPTLADKIVRVFSPFRGWPTCRTIPRRIS